MPDLLFDASSPVKALKLGRVELLYRSYAQWLTFYEVLNAVWEEVYLSKTISAGRAVELAWLLNRVARFMRVLSVEGLEEEVLRTAIDLGLTAYAFNGVSVEEEVVEVLEEARKLRRERADWEFIEKLPPKLKAALKYYVETGDIYVASRIAGLTVDEFNELRVKARVPSVT
jgi:hypothetical protein